jgi:hypothetical protein
MGLPKTCLDDAIALLDEAFVGQVCECFILCGHLLIPTSFIQEGSMTK